jgi:hypothetical protein
MVKDNSDFVNRLCLDAWGAHHSIALIHGGFDAAVAEIMGSVKALATATVESKRERSAIRLPPGCGAR